MLPGSFVANPSRYGRLSTLTPRFRRPSDASDAESEDRSTGNQSPRWRKGSKERPLDREKDEPTVADGGTEMDVSLVKEDPSDIANLFYLEGQADNSPFYNLFFYKKRKFILTTSLHIVRKRK